jgi:hypothetical protein
VIRGRSALVLLAVILPRLSAGQEDERSGDASIRLDDFRLSGPPASALLGISAASVTRPNTPRALIASLVSATGSSGLVPNGYSLETAPFWLSTTHHSATVSGISRRFRWRRRGNLREVIQFVRMLASRSRCERFC